MAAGPLVRCFVRCAIITAAILLAGCAALPRNPVPLDDIYAATIPGMPGIRAWGGKLSADFQADVLESMRQEQQADGHGDDEGKRYASLALSGGGSNGAFGAGYLKGWTAAGTRPEFKLVTGISTGALIAPFAFLGSDFDQQLKAVFTTTSTRDILQLNSIFGVLFKKESFGNATPLENLVEKHIDADLLNAVAERHAQGHRLLIGTTNMDAQRLSIWNMGRIAQYGTPEALELFRKIMVASASIPAAFPPVMIEVELNGKRYDEMHTDGGTITQVFFYGGVIDLRATRSATDTGDTEIGDLYIIRNGRIAPEAEQIDRQLAKITNRAVATIVKNAATNDLYRIFSVTRRDNVAFHYVAIPDDFVSHSEELFDQVEMARLFELGYAEGLAGVGWKNQPPGLGIIDENR